MAPFVHAPLSGPGSPFFAVRQAGRAVRSPLAALAADDVRARPLPAANARALQALSEAACSAGAGATRKREALAGGAEGISTLHALWQLASGRPLRGQLEALTSKQEEHKAKAAARAGAPRKELKKRISRGPNASVAPGGQGFKCHATPTAAPSSTRQRRQPTTPRSTAALPAMGQRTESSTTRATRAACGKAAASHSRPPRWRATARARSATTARGVAACGGCGAARKYRKAA